MLGRAGSTPYGRRGRERERGWLRGAGGARERGGATTPSDLNNFQFQEGKKELEKYRRCDLAEGREEAPKGSRVCDGASLDTAKTAREWEQGWGRPLMGQFGLGEVGALGFGSSEASDPAVPNTLDPMPPLSLASGRAHYIVVAMSFGSSETLPHSSNYSWSTHPSSHVPSFWGFLATDAL